MPERYLYEYAVIRVVPRVEREEFINVGIILFSKRKKFLRAKYVLHDEKLRMLFPEIDIPERFRWLTAVRSTIIQTSRPHPGFLTDPDATFDKLFDEFVM